jgi:general stress protein 26
MSATKDIRPKPGCRFRSMNATPSPAGQSQHFISLLKKFHTAMLVTHTGEYGFHARPMAIARVEDNGRLWFITNTDTAKVHEIEMDSHVHLVAQDGNSAFLSLSGRANLIGDREMIADLWQEPFRVWFPEGKDDPNIELIAVRPERGEFWDSTGANRCKYLWEAAKAYVTGSTPDADDGDLHGKVRL